MTNQSMSTGQQFVEGMTVFDSAGEKVGTLFENDAQSGYIVVQKGWLFPKDLYVPTSSITRSDADGVYLNLHKDDLSGQQYEQAPAGGSMSAGMGSAAATGAAYDTTDRFDTMRTRDASATTATTQTVNTDRDIRVPVMEEELVAGKHEEELGRVHVHKDVVQEQQTVSAPVTHEEVVVERVAVNSDAAAVGADAFVDKDIEVPVMGEELVTGKRAVVTEEVRLHKQAVTEEQQVTDTVRKERVTVDSDGDLTDEQTGGRNRTNR